MTNTMDEKAMWRKKRRSKEISLTEIAKYVGCSSQHLTQWEKKDDYYISDKILSGYKYYIENN